MRKHSLAPFKVLLSLASVLLLFGAFTQIHARRGRGGGHRGGGGRIGRATHGNRGRGRHGGSRYGGRGWRFGGGWGGVYPVGYYGGYNDPWYNDGYYGGYGGGWYGGPGVGVSFGF